MINKNGFLINRIRKKIYFLPIEKTPKSSRVTPKKRVNWCILKNCNIRIKYDTQFLFRE